VSAFYRGKRECQLLIAKNLFLFNQLALYRGSPSGLQGLPRKAFSSIEGEIPINKINFKTGHSGAL
jgi:hypothetical protein